MSAIKKVKMLEALIFGASRQGSVVLEILRAQGIFAIKGFLDDDVSLHGTVMNGLPVLGAMDWAKANPDRSLAAIVAIGNNEARITVGNQLRRQGIELINAIHPSAIVMDGTRMGTGDLICAGAVIVTGTCLEDDVVINTGATVDHDCVLHTGAYISPGVHTAGRVTIGRGAFLGVGAVLGPEVTIGDWCVVGAGSVVLSDLPPNVLAFGSPARIIKELKEPVDWHRVLAGTQGSPPAGMIR